MSQSTFAIHYCVTPADPCGHYFDISLQITRPATSGQRLSLPAWIPGSYMIRDFARNIISLGAQCNGTTVPLRQLDKQTWQAEPCSGPLLINYRVYAWDLSVRSAHFDQNHAYFNGTSLFLQVQGQDEIPCSVELLPPAGEEYKSWRVATTLPRLDAEPWGFGLYQAADYDELIDHPVEMADFSMVEFEAGGVPHAMVLSGRHQADEARLAEDLEAICEEQIRLFGELPPMERYLFLTMVVNEGYGGLEHRSSCSLLCSRSDLPVQGEAEVSETYRNFLGLCSHEYFHTWNIKRIKPAQFIPYPLQQESHTALLWAFEGITSYYDDRMLLLSGRIDRESYLELLGRQLTNLHRSRGKALQTVSESSFNAWTKLYKADENAANSIVSYYTKGAVIALCLDLLIRNETNQQYSMDDVMRALWQEHGKPLRGVSDTGLEALIQNVCGCDLRAFFDRYLRSCEELPVERLLGAFGIRYHLRPRTGADDKGGKAAQGKAPPYSGLRLDSGNGGAKVLSVLNDSPAHLAGVSAGDELVALDGIKVNHSNFDKLLCRYPLGSQLQLHAFRRDELYTTSFSVTEPRADTVYLEIEDDDERARNQREPWLQE